jgi:ubiquinone/menaquinone biosynthesis C-methylase UbiE
MATSSTRPAPNHHAEYPGCTGARGVIAGLTMVVARTGDARLAVELTGTEAGDRVVDVGCGPGTAARFAARLGAQVTGVDPSPAMLGLARRLTRSSAGVTYLDGAAESLPIPDGSATVIWTVASVHHWQDVDVALREVRRVLVPGGRFLAMERPAQPGATGFASHGWTDDQAASFADMCRDHGFAGVQVSRHSTRLRRFVAVRATAPPAGTGAGPT